MVFLGRILDGITAGNLSIAQAYISDHTEPENRAKAFGVIGIAFGIGFMFGPALGGGLGQYGVHVPFIARGRPVGVLDPRDVHAAAARGAGRRRTTEPRPTARRSAPAASVPGAFDFATYAEYFRRPGLARPVRSSSSCSRSRSRSS